jgi:hypothetical protein
VDLAAAQAVPADPVALAVRVEVQEVQAADLAVRVEVQVVPVADQADLVVLAVVKRAAAIL